LQSIAIIVTKNCSERKQFFFKPGLADFLWFNKQRKRHSSALVVGQTKLNQKPKPKPTKP